MAPPRRSMPRVGRRTPACSNQVQVRSRVSVLGCEEMRELEDELLRGTPDAHFLRGRVDREAVYARRSDFAINLVAGIERDPALVRRDAVARSRADRRRSPPHVCHSLRKSRPGARSANGAWIIGGAVDDHGIDPLEATSAI